ncbi:MAG: hemolysin [Bacteroidia bacterium]|nr:MAG: hemolysin [Bacteroidia bacterium]
MILLLATSALVSGSEVAFFALNPSQINKLRSSKIKRHTLIVDLLNKAEELLATILIANNLVNIAIIILSTFITDSLFDFSQSPAWLGIAFQAIVVTFILLLFGEILPKVYASYNSMRFANFMVYPLALLMKLWIFKIPGNFLIYSTSTVNKLFSENKQNISIDDLSEALTLTEGQIEEDKDILEGIVNFTNIEAKAILTPRVDVVAADTDSSFSDLLSLIVESGYSRIPVYHKTFDNIKGVLFVKDLLNHIGEKNFEWQSLIREAYIIPETKKIDDLLKEFQQNKIHMAIVVDEYGGAAGIVTLENVLEEVLGEISDEFDTEKEIIYKKIDNRTYIFEGKTLLNDFYKITDIASHTFDEIKGDAETLAGLFLEIKGEIPQKNQNIKSQGFKFEVVSVDNRRIKEVKIVLPKKQ